MVESAAKRGTKSGLRCWSSRLVPKPVMKPQRWTRLMETVSFGVNDSTRPMTRSRVVKAMLTVKGILGQGLNSKFVLGDEGR